MNAEESIKLILSKEWNRVKDRLPPEGCNCLIILEDIHLPIYCLYKDSEFYQIHIQFKKKIITYLNLLIEGKVLAWRSDIGLSVKK